MKNIARSSKFNMKIDLNKSHGSYVFDKNTNREYLDFFSMYSSLPLGYNHDIFKTDEFKKEIERISSVKITNCEFLSEESESFDKIFSEYAGVGKFDYFHYCCTGALAVETAIKTAIDYKKIEDPKIITFNGSFHGINSWGCFITSRSGGVEQRLDGFPHPFSVKVSDISSSDFIEKFLKNGDIAAVLIEPIQATAGDRYFNNNFFITLRELCNQYDIPLIFDEIQVGFGATGKLWYFEHLGIEPDILIFGKRAQLSGIMVKKKFAEIFKTPIRLEVTWDANVFDMIRCKYIIKAYQKYNILDNVKQAGKVLSQGFKNVKNLKNVRNCGLIVAFDFEDTKICNYYSEQMFYKGMIFNKTGDRTIRFRPSLAISEEEINKSLKIIFSI